MNRAADVLGDLLAPLQQPVDNNNVEAVEDDAPAVIQVDADGIMDGGVAASCLNEDGTQRKRPADCDLILNIECVDNMEAFAPKHPILKQGVTVAIGLDKTTKLGDVFKRYVEFCNEHAAQKLEDGELEFFHCQLLKDTDTAELSALMKNDKILVRLNRSEERESQSALQKFYRDSDKLYFSQMRHLLPDLGGGRYCDVALDCQGKLIDQNGMNQEIIMRQVRANSAFVSKRCKWLGRLIQQAREDEEEMARRSIVTIPTNDDINNNAIDDDESPLAQQQHRQRMMREEEEDDGPDPEDDDDAIGVLAYPMARNAGMNNSEAAEIENDEDEYPVAPPVLSNSQIRPAQRNDASSVNSSTSLPDVLWVTVKDHAPEAVKLLLEYCYTNRVLALGQEAFVAACRTRPQSKSGPVAPYHLTSSHAKRWPQNGMPQLSFTVALSAIRLAEEAGMHRFSLMCEVAASQLVSVCNVIQALSMCTMQKELTGNHLPRLREAAINIVLRTGPHGVYKMPAFDRALHDRSCSIIPTLLTGTMEAVVASQEKRRGDATIIGIKRERSEQLTYDRFDQKDAIEREREREKRRREQGNGSSAGLDDFDEDDDAYVYGDPVVSNWAARTAKQSLKRMAHHHHLAGGSFQLGRSNLYGSRDSAAGNRGNHGASRRRTGSRRRSSERS